MQGLGSIIMCWNRMQGLGSIITGFQQNARFGSIITFWTRVQGLGWIIMGFHQNARFGLNHNGLRQSAGFGLNHNVLEKSASSGLDHTECKVWGWIVMVWIIVQGLFWITRVWDTYLQFHREADDWPVPLCLREPIVHQYLRTYLHYFMMWQ